MKQPVRFVSTLVLCLVLSLVGLLAGVPAARAADTGTWTQLPVFGGGVLCLAINPAIPTTVYAGTDGGGAFRSTDSGATWTAVNTGLTNLDVWALAINPVTPTTVYAGTDGGAGVYRSTDSGGHWIAVNTGLTDPYVYALAINPATPSTLYTSTEGGVFRSTDSGGHWTAVNTGLTNLEVYALAIDPATPSTLYAGTNGSGAFRSTDSGATWTAVNTGLTNLDVWAFAINPATPTTVYAGTDGGAGVYRSTDSGGHWTGVNTGLTNPSVCALAINPATPSTVYTATKGGVFRSTDSGATWTTVNTGLTNLDVWALAINPLTPTILYAGTASAGFRYEAASSYALTTTASPSAGGTITRSPNTASYTSGTVVTLTAIPASGYTFTGWSGDASGTSLSTTVTMSANRSVTAVFQTGALPDLTVDTLSFNPAQPTPGGAVTLAFTVHNQGLGSVTADYDMSIYVDGVYRSGGTDTDRLANGASDNGWHWDTTWPSDTASHTFMVVLDPKGVIAESNESNNSASLSASVTPVMYTLTTTTSPSAGGTITRSPNAASYASGTVVTLTAIPAAGYTFTGWEWNKSDSPTIPPTVTMDADKTVTATFTAIPTYTLTPSASLWGTITPNTVQTVLQGGSQTFTIAANTGFHIAEFSVDGVLQENISSYTFTNVTSNHNIDVKFEQDKKQTVMVLQIGNPMFTVNGRSIALDSPPVIKNGRTLVPIRAIIEALGGTVGWDGTARKATVALGRATIELWIGKNTARVNGVTTPIDAANVKVVPEIINGRTMLPLRFVSESLGCSIVWVDATKTITITYLP